jgi:type I restriction-modification system DNA methylase subunit
MSTKIQKIVAQYIDDLKLANKEEPRKLRFQQLITQLFSSDPEALATIAKMSNGAEKALSIPLPERLKTGYADIQYNHVILEWKYKLSKSGEVEASQLADYLLANWHSGRRNDFTLIATDGLEWRVYAPEFTAEFVFGKSFPKDSAVIKLTKTASFVLSATNLLEFYFFLDRYLFKTLPQRPTLDNIRLDFGDTSPMFRKAIVAMAEHLPNIEGNTEIDTAFRQWQRFLSIAYGKFDSSYTMFFVHTYLSVFAKLLAYAVLKPSNQVHEEELKGILTGDMFNKLNVQRFVEGDFYYWAATDAHFEALLPVFHALLAKIGEYDFKEVQEDILKGVYQELIDLETRHALGEYYTPDWLCERIVAEIPIEEDSRILDPACGSGSFLRAAVARLQGEYPGRTADQLASQVVGIDIHPLSVQIAKTTLLLALGDTVLHTKKPVTLQVYLANSLFLPDDAASLFGNVFYVRVDGAKYPLDISALMAHPTDFDTAIETCQSTIDFYNDREVKLPEFASILKTRLKTKTAFSNIAADFHKIYLAMRNAKLAGRDTIWKFILQNLYKPVFLSRTFDIVIGNPPWLTYSDVANADYQDELALLATGYNLTPGSKANMPHLEIAAIFQSHASSYFLKDGGTLAFVLPRSLLTADQHDNSRSGKAIGFKLQAVWDLQDVVPLFRVPSCVLFSRAMHARSMSAELKRSLPVEGLSGKKFAGRLPHSQVHWPYAKTRLTESPATWFYSKLSEGKKTRSALTITQQQGQFKKSHYAPLFKQGATIVPRSFYFVEADQKVIDYDDRMIQWRTSSSVLTEAKAPWKSLLLDGRVHSQYLFRTALAKSIVPFVLVNPPLVLLPIELENKGGLSKIKLRDHKEMFAAGDVDSATWFAQASQYWEKNKTGNASASGMTLLKRLDFQRGLTEQNLNDRYVVIFNRSAQDGNACVVDRSELDLLFIVDFAAYCFTTTIPDEAHFVCAFLNSGYTNTKIKEFQSRGLFGARDVTKKILDVPFPKFNRQNDDHISLAALSLAAAKASEIIVGNGAPLDLEPRALGRLRRTIRLQLKSHFEGIDKLVEKISLSA